MVHVPAGKLISDISVTCHVDVSWSGDKLVSKVVSFIWIWNRMDAFVSFPLD